MLAILSASSRYCIDDQAEIDSGHVPAAMARRPAGNSAVRSDVARGIMIGAFRVTSNAVVNSAEFLDVASVRAATAIEALEQSAATRIEVQIADGEIPWRQRINGR
jgi:hypothetical protein